MARIDFDDNVESQPEFWRLLPLVNNDRDCALGKLVRFFRLSQRAYGKRIPMTGEELANEGLGVMIKSGWAVKDQAGNFQAKGADKHFDWYQAKVEAAVAGGRARSAAPRDERGRYLSNDEAPPTETAVYPAGFQRTPAEVQPDASHEPAVASPLALAPAPVLAPAPTYGNTPAQEAVPDLKQKIAQAEAVFRETLRFFGQGRELREAERLAIGRAIQRENSVKAVIMALEGARYEPSSDKFRPADWVNLSRYLDPKHFSRFLGYGARQAQRAKPAEAAPEAEAVRDLLNQALGGVS